jgi:hypothetical protein
MSFLEELGPPVESIDENEFVEKLTKISPFDFSNSITFNKDNLIVDDWSENQYNAFIVNRSLGFGADTAIAANEMNCRPHTDNKMQYEFLKGVIRKSKRYNKWIKAEEENLQAIQTFFKYSYNKAKEALRILSPEDIESIKEYNIASKGGKV